MVFSHILDIMAIGLPILAVGIAIDQYVKNKLRHDKTAFVDKLEKAIEAIKDVSGAKDVTDTLKILLDDAKSISASEHLCNIARYFTISSLFYLLIILCCAAIGAFFEQTDFWGYTSQDIMKYVLMFTVLVLGYQIFGMFQYARSVKKFNDIIDEKTNEIDQECKKAELAKSVSTAASSPS